MSEQFQPGDLVECVDGNPDMRRGPPYVSPLPISGELYTVQRFGPDAAGRPSLFLQGWPNISFIRGFDIGWHPARFRKIYRPDPKLIERLTAEPVIMPPVRQPNRVDA